MGSPCFSDATLFFRPTASGHSLSSLYISYWLCCHQYESPWCLIQGLCSYQGSCSCIQQQQQQQRQHNCDFYICSESDPKCHLTWLWLPPSEQTRKSCLTWRISSSSFHNDSHLGQVAGIGDTPQMVSTVHPLLLPLLGHYLYLLRKTFWDICEGKEAWGDLFTQ